MSLRQNQLVNRRSKSLSKKFDSNENSFEYTDLEDFPEEFLDYLIDKYPRNSNLLKIYKNQRSRQAFQRILDKFNQTDFDDYIDFHKSNHSTSLTNLSYLDQISFNSNRRIPLFDNQTRRNQSCEITIVYKKDVCSSCQIDQILIKQKENNNEKRILVYKGYLKTNEKFVFKSLHDVSYPFDIKFYVNGYQKGHLFTCCEFKSYQKQIQIENLFLIEQIDKSIPCLKCKQRQQKQITSKKIFSNDQSFQKLKKKKSKEMLINADNSTNRRFESESNKSEAENESNRILIKESSTTNGDSVNLFESLLSLLENGFDQMEVRQSLADRYEGNVEDFVVILFGIDEDIHLFNSIVNFVQIFSNVDQLNSFVNTLEDENILLITNDLLIESIEDLSLYKSIYILSTQSESIVGYYSNINEIIEQMKKDIENENKNLLKYQLVNENESENQSFSYSLLLKELILKKDVESNLKKDFLDYCRYHYSNNSYQLNLIDQFENEIENDKGIDWFRKDSFISKMINRALRREEIDLLYKLRYILQLINYLIKENSLANIVYKFHYLSQQQIQLFQNNLNGLIIFSTFLHCQFNPTTNLIEKNENLERVLFRIKSRIGMDLRNVRSIHSNVDVLLPLDSVFLIKSIEKDDENNRLIIDLIGIEKDNKQIHLLTNRMRKEIEGPVVLIEIGKLLIFNNDSIHCDYLSRLLFKDQSLKGNPTLLASLAAIHHLLGSVDHQLNNYQSARLQFEQSLKIFLTFLSEENQILSPTYNNIGSMFYQQDQYDQAILYHQKALQCQLKASIPDIQAIATYSANIAAVYLDQKEYQQALNYYQRSLQILQQSTSNEESLSIAMIYDRIASIYWRMDKPTDALPFYQKALQLELKFLHPNDHKISVSYFNLSTAYAKLNRLDEAIDSAEKSLEQLLKSVPADHPEVKENTQQLEGLRRRKWIQHLYQ